MKMLVMKMINKFIHRTTNDLRAFSAFKYSLVRIKASNQVYLMLSVGYTDSHNEK